jgi:glycerol-3-phosphate dehydrogenase (NAD(P)+)
MELLGGKPETARELAGVGDMFVTSHRAALEKLTGRGIVREEDFPLMRHLYAVVGKDEPLDMPWKTFFGGEAASAS